LSGTSRISAAGAPFATHAQGATLAVRLTPKSDRDAVEGVEVAADGRSHVKVRLRALPAEGAANEALTRLLAKWIGVPRGGVSVLSGATSRNKIVLVRGDGGELAERMRGLLSARST
jgi:uncharacterized protein YggU (UPF0235/DUF167 family)